MITVICSNCGGLGNKEYLNKKGHWAKYVCPECGGRGTVLELSFEEKKFNNKLAFLRRKKESENKKR